MITKCCLEVASTLCCKLCDYNTCKKSSYDKHLLTAKHINDTIKVMSSCPKVATKFVCNNCHYNTSKKSSYDKHLLTAKHINDNIKVTKCFSNVAEKKSYDCECGKQYTFYSGLSRHKQQCNLKLAIECNIIKQEILAPMVTDASNNIISGELVLELLKQNNEFRELIKDQNKQMVEQNKYFIENQNKQLMEQNKYFIDNQNKQMMDQNKQMMDQNKQMMELVSKGIGNTINSNNTIIKTKFNLNIFLNEQCKDAMNIMDFVNSLQLKLSDLERVGELGYVKGISHIILNKLKALDICKRPIHCSDLKRETMYVKDENAWEKENGKNEKITKMIKHVAHKNQLQINEWRQENPAHKNPESIKCDKFLAIVNQSMGGSTEDDDINNYNKIIKNIAKEVIIDKEQE